MNTSSFVVKNRVLFTSIASLLATHVGLAVDANFSSGAMTGDADSGVSTSKTYTALANVIGGNVVVNGATFIGSGAGLSGAGWDLTGTPNTFGSGGIQQSLGGSAISGLFDGFQYAGNPAVLTMSGLTAGTTYVATLYNQAWTLPDNRVQLVTSSEGASTVFNEDAFAGSVLKYTFVATGSTTVLNFGQTVFNYSMHFYGLSNEEVFSGNAWSPASGNDWNAGGNWSTSVQNGLGTNASFSDQGVATNVTVDSPTTIGHMQILGSSPYTFSGANTLTFQADAGGSSVLKADAGSHTISAPVQFNTAVSKFGNGSVSFTGAVAGSGKGLTVGSGAVTFQTATPNLSSIGPIRTDGVLNFVNAAAQQFDPVISGSGSLTKSGAGTLTLNGVNSYSGATTVSNGTLLLGGTSFLVGLLNPGFENTGSLGGGGWTYGPTGADWTFTAVGGNAGISSNGQPWVSTAPEGSHAGFIQLGGAVSQAITFGSAANFDISFKAANRPGFNPTGLLLKVDGVVVSSIAPSGLQNGGVFQDYKFANVPISAGSHTISFAGSNLLGGDTATAIDAISIASTVGMLPSGTALSLTNAGASVDLNGHKQTVGSLAGAAGTTVQNSGGLTVGGDGNSTAFDGIISGPGSFTKLGNGVMTMSAAQAYGGSTTVGAGTVQLTGGSLPTNTAVSLTRASSSLNLGGTGHTFGSLTGVAGSSLIGGGAAVAAGSDNSSTTFAGSLTGVGALTKLGNGKLVLAGAINYSGDTLVNGGSLRLESANTGNSGVLTMVPGSSLDLTAASHTFSGLTGNGTITPKRQADDGRGRRGAHQHGE